MVHCGTLIPKNKLSKVSKHKLHLYMSRKNHFNNIELIKQLNENLSYFRNDLAYHILAGSAEKYYKKFYQSQIELIKKYTELENN